HRRAGVGGGPGRDAGTGLDTRRIVADGRLHAAFGAGHVRTGGDRGDDRHARGRCGGAPPGGDRTWRDHRLKEIRRRQTPCRVPVVPDLGRCAPEVARPRTITAYRDRTSLPLKETGVSKAARREARRRAASTAGPARRLGTVWVIGRPGARFSVGVDRVERR